MIPLPLSVFPIGVNATKSSGFAIAVLIGLAVFMAQQKKSSGNAHA